MLGRGGINAGAAARGARAICLVIIYVILVIVLMFRPQGLFKGMG